MSFLWVPHLHPTIVPLVQEPFWGLHSDWSQIPSWGPSDRVPTESGLDGVPTQTGLDKVPLSQDWIRYPSQKGLDGPPPSPSQDWIGYPQPGLHDVPLPRTRWSTPFPWTGRAWTG